MSRDLPRAEPRAGHSKPGGEGGVLCWDGAAVLSLSLSQDIGLEEPSLPRSLWRCCAPSGCLGCCGVLEAGSPGPVNKLWSAVAYL